MSAKEIEVLPISKASADEIVRAIHYSGSVVMSSSSHFGVRFRGRWLGAMQFGNPLDKRKLISLVEGTGWSQMIELNRMAFSDELPRNSESRAIGVACRELKRRGVAWVASFADASQCGDGAIYRASGFVLTAIKKTSTLFRLPGGKVIHEMSLKGAPTTPREELGGKSFFDVSGGKYTMKSYLALTGAEPLPGFQLRYVKFLDESFRERLTCEEIPFSEIDRAGAGMYRGKKCVRSETGDTAGFQPEKGGSTPTLTLHPEDSDPR